VEVEPGLADPAAILLLGATRDSNQDEWPGQLLPEPGCDLIAVKARQADVEQHRIRSPSAGEIDRLTSIEGNLDVMAEEV
jgi:hypothetical protein